MRFVDRIDSFVKSRGHAICYAALNDPIPQEWNQYVTQSPIALEVVQDVLYDTLTYTSASTTVLTFFQNTIGGTNKGITNMQQPGLLPNPESFLVIAPRFYVKWTAVIATTAAGILGNDLAQLVNTSVITLKFGNKTYGPLPTWMFSAGSYPDFRFTMASTSAQVISSYAQLQGPLFAFVPNLMISPLQSFQLIMEWPAGAVTLTNGNPAIEWVYEGQRARAIQ